MIPAVAVKIIIGVVLYLAVNRKDAVKLKNLTAWAVITALGTAGFWVLEVCRDKL